MTDAISSGARGPGVSPDGRWGGRLASRALPEVDETIEALSEEERKAGVVQWLGRAAAERRASDAFVVIEKDLRAVNADPSLVALAARAIDDELRHAEICRVVAGRYARRDLDPPERLVLDPPAHANAPPSLVPVLHVIGQCAINETTATAFLEACLAHAEGPLVRAALRELLSDDVDHARIGWAFLTAASAETKQAVAPFVLWMLNAHVRWWRGTRSPRPSERMNAHGALAPRIVEDAILESIRALIVPGLQAVGVPTATLQPWVDRGCPT
jgi:hypothetical protein